jgi:hypothetical protein
MVVCESSPFSLGVRKSCKSINLFAAAGVGFSSETVAQKMSQKAIYLYTHIIISATSNDRRKVSFRWKSGIAYVAGVKPTPVKIFLLLFF